MGSGMDEVGKRRLEAIEDYNNREKLSHEQQTVVIEEPAWKDMVGNVEGIKSNLVNLDMRIHDINKVLFNDDMAQNTDFIPFDEWNMGQVKTALVAFEIRLSNMLEYSDKLLNKIIKK